MEMSLATQAYTRQWLKDLVCSKLRSITIPNLDNDREWNRRETGINATHSPVPRGDVMSKKRKRKKRGTTSIGEAIENSIDQGLLRSAATMGQQMMEQALKTDPKIRSLVERLVKERLERTLRRLADEKK
jgi:hypothetical protein